MKDIKSTIVKEDDEYIWVEHCCEEKFYTIQYKIDKTIRKCFRKTIEAKL